MRSLSITRQPKDIALAHTGVPMDLRVLRDWMNGRWPRDSRPRAKDIDPLRWPEGLRRGELNQLILTLAGPNGSGKSTRAAHLLFKLIQAGFYPGQWFREFHLVEEARSFQSSVSLQKAIEAGALVLDEVAATRGAAWREEIGHELIFNVLNERLEKRRPTILTTHRPLSRAGAKKRGQSEDESIEGIAPSIYDRLRDGLIIGLENRSYRGSWALGAETDEPQEPQS